MGGKDSGNVEMIQKEKREVGVLHPTHDVRFFTNTGRRRALDMRQEF
jgi:hypothetical protein